MMKLTEHNMLQKTQFGLQSIGVLLLAGILFSPAQASGA